MASGTGGHVIPALAMARALQERGYAVRWLGTPQGIEQRLVKDTDIVIDTIPMVGIRGKGIWRWIAAPFILLSALLTTIRLFKKHRPVAVLGMGGFVTGPGGVAAYCLQIPLVSHEQNAIPGLANRLLKPFARRVMVAFPNTFTKTPKPQNPKTPVVFLVRKTNYFDRSCSHRFYDVSVCVLNFIKIYIIFKMSTLKSGTSGVFSGGSFIDT